MVLQNERTKQMARYIILLRFTDEGARRIRKSALRALAFKKQAGKLGVTVEAQLWSLGQYDGLLILSGEEQAILRSLTQLSELGNVRTETLKALTADEVKGLAG